MSQAYKRKTKLNRIAKRHQTDSEGLRYGTVANRIRRGVMQRFSWWKGPARFVAVDENKKPIERKPRDGGITGKRPPYSKRWKRAKVHRRGPKIVDVLQALFG